MEVTCDIDARECVRIDQARGSVQSRSEEADVERPDRTESKAVSAATPAAAVMRSKTPPRDEV